MCHQIQWSKYPVVYTLSYGLYEIYRFYTKTCTNINEKNSNYCQIIQKIVIQTFNAKNKKNTESFPKQIQARRAWIHRAAEFTESQTEDA